MAAADVQVQAFKAEIRRTFSLVEPIASAAAAIFYPTLWEIDPSTKPLFKNTDMDKQGEKLMKTLGIAVAMLGKMERLVPILQNLGKKHVSYGVTADMYPSVGRALLLTLEKGLGDECTAETKAAWTWVLGVISDVCIEAAKEVDPNYGEKKEEDPKTATEVEVETPEEAVVGGGGGEEPAPAEEGEVPEATADDIEGYKAEISRSFELVQPMATEAAAIFYPTLWEIDPSTKPLFKNTDMAKQGAKLMKILGMAVRMLGKMDKLVPLMRSLGKRHVGYGVTAAMYPSVAQALLMTFEKGLGDECTSETKAAWGWVMGLLSGACIEAAKEVDPTYADKKQEEAVQEVEVKMPNGVETPRAVDTPEGGEGGGGKPAPAEEGEVPEATADDIEGYKAEICRSFDLVQPMATEAAAIFYPTLWELDPSTKVAIPAAV